MNLRGCFGFDKVVKIKLQAKVAVGPCKKAAEKTNVDTEDDFSAEFAELDMAA